MGEVLELSENIELPGEIVDAGLRDFVLFVGAGVSRGLKLPSWSELADKVLEDFQEKGYLNFSKIDQLKKLNPKQKLSVADLIGKRKGKRQNYEVNISIKECIKECLKNKNKDSNLYETINGIGCRCVTTNYDELLTPCFPDKKDGSTTAVSQERVCNKEKLLDALLNEPGGAIHLHGAISKPETMIVTAKQYLEHYNDKDVKEFLQELFENKTVLFIGYGLEEAEILEHILRGGSAKKEGQDNIRKYFALQGFFQSEQTLYKELHAYYEESFGVHLLGFTRDYEDYKCLEKIIERWAPKINVRKAELVDDYNFINEVLNYE